MLRSLACSLVAGFAIAAGCGGTSADEGDAGDASPDGAPADGSIRHDGGGDATVDSSTGDDATIDVTSDAAGDATTDAASDADEAGLDVIVIDAPLDAPPPPPDGGDAGICGAPCPPGYDCCTVQNSFNYGKCYNKACLACCQ